MGLAGTSASLKGIDRLQDEDEDEKIMGKALRKAKSRLQDE